MSTDPDLWMAMQTGRVAIDSALAKLNASQVDEVRESLLERARMQVVGCFYRIGVGDITSEMRSAAKVAITDELQSGRLKRCAGRRS